MTQLTIVTTPVNSGDGTPLATAFNYCNSNFNELYARFQVEPPASLTGTTGDVPGMYAVDPTYFYYCFAAYDGSSTIWGQLTQIGNVSVSSISNGTSNIKISNINGNATTSVGGTSNVLVVANTGQYVSGLISATGNISGNYILGNGSQLTGISGVGNYSNSNVVSLLAAFGSNTISTTGSITSGNIDANQITAVGIQTTGASGNIYGANVITAVTLSATGNITGNYFIGNGSQLTGLPSGFSNAEVVAYGEAGWSGNIIPSANVTYSLGNSTNWWANAWFGANTIYIGGTPVGVTGNILTVNGANVVTANTSGTLNADDILVTGNITGSYLIGNGSQLTGVTADSANAETLSGTFLAANVLASSLTSVGNLTSLSVVGTTQSGNLATGGTVSATGNVTGGNLRTAGLISATGNVTAGNIATAGTISATGNVDTAGTVSATGNVDTAGTVSATGTITGGNVATGGTVSATGTATVGNLATGGTVSATGTVTGGNVATGGTVSATGNVTTAGNVSATGNVTGGNLYTSGNSSATGNVTGGNLYTGGLVSATGNVTGNNLVGNTLTGTLTTALQPAITQVGTLGSLAVTAGISSGTLGVSGNTTLNNLNITGTTNITGNITQLSGNSAQFFGDSDGFGALYAGLAFGYANLSQTVLQVSANYNDYAQINLQNTDSGADATADYVATADNGTDATYFVDMGIASSTFNGLSANIAGNSIVANDAYLYTVGNTQADPGGNLIIGAVTEGKIIKLIAGGGDTANVVATVANTGITVTGILSATGNTIGNNLIAVSNVTAGNVLTGGIVSAVGNVTSGNVLTGGIVSAAGNVTSGNIRTAGTVSATGNVTSGNVITAGIVSATGNVIGNYVLGNGSQLTGIAIGTPTSISNGTSSIGFSGSGGNIIMSVAGTSTAIFDTNDNIVLGLSAQRDSGKTGAVVIGANAGSSGTGYNSVAIGAQAAGTSSGDRSVAVGFAAGQTNQGDAATALGPTAGYNAQGVIAVAVGQSAGFEYQGYRAVAVGDESGYTSQGGNAVAIGGSAGYNAQGASAVAVGLLAGNTTQGGAATAVGPSAGQTNQGASSVAIGDRAGTNQQATRAVAVGQQAGGDTQSTGAVAIGYQAGIVSQGANAVAIGYFAGRSSQGANSIAIGGQAGYLNQVANSIVINASGAQINAANPGLYITPVRKDIGNTGNILTYNTSTLETTYSNTISIAGNIITSANISGSYILGNGALLTGIDATSIQNGTSNVRVAANGNITMSVSNVANVVVVTSNSVSLTGNLSVTGNITQNGGAIYGVYASYAKYKRTTPQSGTIVANTVIVCDVVESLSGSDVAVNTTSGQITLQPNKTYRLRGGVPNWQTSGATGSLQWCWFNETTTGFIGSSGENYPPNSGAAYGTSGGTAEVVITPTVTTVVSFRVLFASSVSQLGGSIDWSATGSYPWIDAQVIGGQAAINALSTTGNVTAGNLVLTGDVVADNIGNITPINLNQSPTQVLYGDGIWKSPPASSMLNITKFDQGATYGTNLMVADGRLFAIKGQNYNYTSGLGVVNPVVQNGVSSTYEIVFPNETVGTLTDAGSYGDSSYALFSSGNLYTWGRNTYGQLGLGNTTNIFVPTLSNTSVAQVYTHPSSMSGDVASYVRLIIRKNDNTFWGVGYNGQGQFGNGTSAVTVSTWTQLVNIPTTVLSVWNIGNYNGCTVIQKADGSIWVAGGNVQGNLGLGNTSNQTTFVLATGWIGGDSTMRIQYISYGGRYYDGSGQDYYWMAMFLDNGTSSRLCGAGANNWGCLGTGNTTNSNVPVVPLTSTGLTGRIAKIRNVACSPGVMYVRMTNGDLFSYGYNTYGAVGNGTTTQVNTPYKLLTGNCADIHNDQMGWYTYGFYSPSAIVEKTDGTFWCCGYNSYGAVGSGSTTSTITSLQQMLLPKGSVIKFVGTNNGSNEAINKFIVTADNTIWAYGYNGQYNISGTSTNNYWVPVNFAPTALKSN